MPPIVQERWEDDFIRLRQGASSVAEYETQFTKLSRFAPDLVQTEQKRIRHFVQGLNVDIQEVFAAAQLDILSQALEKIQRIETVMGQVKAFHDRKGGNLARETSLPDRAREMSHPLRWVEGRVVHNPQKSQNGVLLEEVREGKGHRGVQSVEGQLKELSRPVVSEGAITLPIIVGKTVRYENAINVEERKK